MMKKSNKNYTNFDSYEFAEIRRYPYPVSVSGIRIRYPYPLSVSGTRIRYPVSATRIFATIPVIPTRSIVMPEVITKKEACVNS